MTAPDCKLIPPDAPLKDVPLTNDAAPEVPATVASPEPTETLPVERGDEPLLNTTPPETPEAVKPLDTITGPELPLNVVPLLKSKAPLVPTETAFAERINSDPDDDEAPLPLTMLTLPPTAAVSVVEPPNT